MLKKTLQKLRGRVVAFVPTYDEDGRNRTLICLRDGSSLLQNASLSRVLRFYLALWALERMQLQALYACPYQYCQIAPLAITGHHTLLPLRARAALRRRDGAYAWVEYESLNLEQLGCDARCQKLNCGLHQLELLVSRQHLMQMVYWAAWTKEQRIQQVESGELKVES